MRKAVSVVLLSLMFTMGTLVNAAVPATADTPRCVTYTEFRQIDKGIKKARVHRVFDVSGQPAGGFAGGYTRYYGSCQAVRNEGGDGGASVSYDGDTNRVVEKRWNGYR